MDGSLLLTSIVHNNVGYICYKWKLIPVNDHGVALIEHEKTLRLFPLSQHGGKYIVVDEQATIKLASFDDLLGKATNPVDLPLKFIKNGCYLFLDDGHSLSVYEISRDGSLITRVSKIKFPENYRWSLIKDYYVIIGDEKITLASPAFRSKVFISNKLLNVVTLIPNRKYLLVYKEKYNIITTIGSIDLWRLTEDIPLSLPLKNAIVALVANKLYLVNENNHIFSINTKNNTRKKSKQLCLDYHLTLPFFAASFIALDNRFLLVSTKDFCLLKVDTGNLRPTFEQFLPPKVPIQDLAFMHSSSRELNTKEGFVDWPVTYHRAVRPFNLSLHMFPFLITQSNLVASLVSILDIPRAEYSSVKILDSDNVFDYWVSDRNTLVVRHLDLSISLYSKNPKSKDPALKKCESFFQLPVNEINLEDVLSIKGNCILYKDKCIQVSKGRVETFHLSTPLDAFDIIPNYGIVYCANSKLEFLSFQANAIVFIQAGSYYTIKTLKESNHLHILFTDGSQLYYHNISPHKSLNSTSSIKLAGILEIEFRESQMFCCLTSDGGFHDIILNEVDSNLYLKRQRVIGGASFSRSQYHDNELFHFWGSPTVSHGLQHFEYTGLTSFSLPIECQKPLVVFEGSLLYGNSLGIFLLQLPVFSPEKYRIMNVNQKFFSGFLRWTFPLRHTENGFLFAAISLKPVRDFQMEATLMLLNQRLDIVYQESCPFTCSNVTVLDDLSVLSKFSHTVNNLHESFIVAYSRPDEDVLLVLYTLRRNSEGFYFTNESITLDSVKYVRDISVFDNQLICSGTGSKVVELRHNGTWTLETGRLLSSDVDLRQTIILGDKSLLHLTNSGFYADGDLNWEGQMGQIDKIDRVILLRKDVYCLASLTGGKVYIVEIKKDFELELISQQKFPSSITCIYYDIISCKLFVAIDRARLFSLIGEKFNFSHMGGVPF
ncbi:BA75_03725T0 [Komagataella pastoris]|uniref:BA75_03725T0 n=1 Tax=Komagataella pastoris TaxID=4922 RepID=A0A1B2JFB7_PICPA|nr:BA75_03725T0 [Komagataella pastoris]